MRKKKKKEHACSANPTHMLGFTSNSAPNSETYQLLQLGSNAAFIATDGALEVRGGSRFAGNGNHKIDYWNLSGLELPLSTMHTTKSPRN